MGVDYAKPSISFISQTTSNRKWGYTIWKWATQTPSTRALEVEALQYILQINGKVVTDAITVVVRKEG